MKNKLFECPYLTAEDKEFLKYEQKMYEQNFKMLLEFHKKHEKLLKRTDDEAEKYENAVYSSLCFDTGSDVFYALTLTHVHFVDDICDYFSITRDIKELNSEERTMEEVINETEMLALDEVFDKYIRKYWERKSNEMNRFKNMKYIISDLLYMRKGKVVDITVWDGFSGDVKIIQNRLYKWLIEIVDVVMCYPQQVQLKLGEQMWISKKDLFRDYAKHTYKKHRKHKMLSPKCDWDDELPF